MTRQKLERKFNTLKDENPREAAEIAYALAELYLKEGNTEKATQFGKESIRLFDKCKMDTQEDCAAIHTKLGGIMMPELIHQDVVRNRLKALKL